MNRLLSTLIVSFLVSISTLSIYHFALLPDRNTAIQSTNPAKENSSRSVFASYTDSGTGPGLTPGSMMMEVPDFRLAAEKTMPAVVHISSKRNYNERRYNPWEDLFGMGGRREGSQVVSTGSGVIINANGLIVTNNHVIQDADELEVTLFDSRKYPAKVIGTDPNTDLGLIKIEAGALPFVEPANSDEAVVGEWVLAVGNPFNLSSTATAGIVSAIGRGLGIIKEDMAVESFIQTDAAVNPGNSGGALVNLEGKLIGINTAIASPTGTYAGYAFAVPMNIVRKVVDDLNEFGKVQRAFLGVQQYKTGPEGVAVQGIVDGGGAAKAGLRDGDVIIAIDGVKVGSEGKLIELISRNRPGDMVSATYLRDGVQKSARIQLTDSRGATQLVASNRIEILSELGVEFEDVDPKFLKRYGLEHGVAVTKLVAGKVRSQTDMQQDFIIIKVNGNDVGNKESLIRLLERSQGNIILQGFYAGDRYLREYKISL